MGRGAGGRCHSGKRMSDLVRYDGTPIAAVSKIETAIAEATTPDAIKQVIALADAAVAFASRYYSERKDIIQRAKALKLKAERKLGEILAAMPKATGAKGVGPIAVPKENRNQQPPTLADIGIDKKLSARAQKLAALPDEEFAAVASGEVPVSRVIAGSKKAARRAPQRSKVAQARQEAVAEAQAKHVSMFASYARMTIKELQSDREFSDEEIRLAEELAEICARVVRRAQAQPA